MNKNNFYIFLTIFSLSLFAQDKEEIPLEEQRDNKIKALLEIVKKNKDIYVSEDRVRLEKFISLVDEREKLLNSAKNQLAQEIKRNEILEDTFQKNEKALAELEESLQIKVGVLGELFGVTRQFAGELKSGSENDVTFSEFPERINTLNEIGSIKIHNKENFEDLWIAYLSQIASGSEIKTINANITFPDGENQIGEIVRYGLFSATHNRKFLKPEPDLNSFLLLENQPESSILRSIRRHQNSDVYRSAAIDPTRGFLLSLYMDKAGWIERIAQGKSIGFIIILIGILGLAFSIYKLRLLKQYEVETISEDGDSITQKMNNAVNEFSNKESQESSLDEIIINFSSKVEWGNNWVKFFAAVAPLLGLLGTVIGMIETFQAITLFGTGDPKQMAGGISQALVTTMLGLIVAAPLLGMFTYLSEKSNTIIQVIEEKASYLLSRK
jgi:biopolymer transport protein ExbB